LTFLTTGEHVLLRIATALESIDSKMVDKVAEQQSSTVDDDYLMSLQQEGMEKIVTDWRGALGK
jgi:hypothetical protein